MDKNNFSDISAVQNNPQKNFQTLFYIFIQQPVQKKFIKGYNKQLSSYSESVIIIQEYFFNCDILIKVLQKK